MESSYAVRALNEFTLPGSERKRLRSKAIRNLVILVALIAGVVYFWEDIVWFVQAYAQHFAEALWVIVAVVYLTWNKLHKQPRFDVVVSDDSVTIPVSDLVIEGSDTELYADCAILSSNIYKEPTDLTAYRPYMDFIELNEAGKYDFLDLDNRVLLEDWDLLEVIGTVKNSKLVIETWVNHSRKLFAIAFRGTTGLNGWVSNAHWLVKWLPFKDQYDHAKVIVPDIVDRLIAIHPDYKIIATGHSLGGGLAQHACYLREEVTAAYVFNSSPVTGYTDLNKKHREKSTQGVRIHRLYERGEALEYLRFFMKIVYLFDPKPNRNPYLVEHRFDFRSAGLITQHGIHPLTIGLNFVRDNPDYVFEEGAMEAVA